MYYPIPLQIRGGFDGVEAASASVPAPLRHRTAGGGDMKKSEKLRPWRGAVSYRKIAEEVGRSESHVYRVMKGERKGSVSLRRLLRKFRGRA